MRCLLLFLILVISIGLTVSYVEAGTNIIEFKKKYVTNSPKVCGDKLCDEISSDKSYKKKNNQTPLGQYKNGIPIHKITCKSNYVFVLKVSNWHPACITSESLPKLVRIGWAANPQEFENMINTSTKKEAPLLSPLTEYRKEFPIREGYGMEVTFDSFSGKPFVVFNGFGWHGYHNVEITISKNSEIIEFMMTQTEPDGTLYLPWQIPDDFSSEWYHVYASDGIHEYEIDIPIILD